MIAPDDYLDSMREVGIEFEELTAAEISRALAGLPAAGRDDRPLPVAWRDRPRRPWHGRDATAGDGRARRASGSSPVTRVTDHGSHLVVDTGQTAYTCRGVVVCADAWTNDVLAGLGVHVPLTVTLEQATYFAPPDPTSFAGMPLWIWMDEPSYYGFPCYGEPTLKAAQDCGGPTVSPDARTSDVDAAMLDRLSSFMGALLPDSGIFVRSLRCQYTLTPDRDFVLAPVPGHPSVVVGLGAAHGFKFAPTFGRALADLVTTGETTSDVAAFTFDRPGLTDPAFEANWMV